MLKINHPIRFKPKLLFGIVWAPPCHFQPLLTFLARLEAQKWPQKGYNFPKIEFFFNIFCQNGLFDIVGCKNKSSDSIGLTLFYHFQPVLTFSADLAAQNGPKIVEVFLKSSNFNIHGQNKLSDPVENKKNHCVAYQEFFPIVSNLFRLF